jgi:hypothetical protein
MPIEVVWEQLLGRGLEHLSLREDATIEADGVAVGILEDAAYRIQYRITCDASWNVQRFTVQSLLNSERASLMRRGSDWLDEQGRLQAALSGCTEVDIMVTPFTNSLPIRRLGLRSGQAAPISVAYVTVPGLAVSRADQVYSCLQTQADGGIVRYRSVSTGFTADLKVDADGLVTDYPGIFRQIWKKRTN